MKYLLTIIIVLTCFVAQAQSANMSKIIGTWELTQATYSRDNQVTTATPERNNFRRYKIITPTNFVVIDIDPKTNITRTSILGTYTFANGKYTEKLLNVNQEARTMIGSQNTFDLKFDNADMMAIVGGFNGFKTDEKWKRVKTMP